MAAAHRDLQAMTPELMALPNSTPERGGGDA